MTAMTPIYESDALVLRFSQETQPRGPLGFDPDPLDEGGDDGRIWHLFSPKLQPRCLLMSRHMQIVLRLAPGAYPPILALWAVPIAVVPGLHSPNK